MPWPNSQIDLLASESGTGNSITANWVATTAGRLLLGFYGNAVTGTPSPPWTPAGWTYMANFGSHYIIGKVSDGTETTVTIAEGGGAGHETSLDILSAEVSASLAGPLSRMDTTIVQDTTGGSPDTLDSAVVAGTVDLRIDYGIGDFGISPAPGVNAPAVLIVGHSGRAFQRANSVHATQVDPPIAGGGTFTGGTITDAQFALSIFLHLVPLVPPCTPVTPTTLHIPFKDRLDALRRDFTLPGIERAQVDQLANMQSIEWWARDWMTLAESPDRCILFIPHKDHSRQPQVISAAQSFDNFKAIERWGHDIVTGACGCNCTEAGADPPPARCSLFIPFKDFLRDVDMTDEDQLAQAAAREFDNFKAIEQWADRYARGECGCTMP